MSEIVLERRTFYLELIILRQRDQRCIKIIVYVIELIQNARQLEVIFGNVKSFKLRKKIFGNQLEICENFIFWNDKFLNFLFKFRGSVNKEFPGFKLNYHIIEIAEIQIIDLSLYINGVELNELKYLLTKCFEVDMRGLQTILPRDHTEEIKLLQKLIIQII